MTTPARQRWAVVGGGMLGLTLAHRLAKQGQQVTLYEGAPELGGLASAWQLGSVTWDRHYHVTLLSDMRLRALLEELGLEREMQWVETKTGFYTDGRLVSMSNAIEFLKFPPLSLLSKFRLALTILYASRLTDWKSLERIPVADWLGKWSGRQTLEKIWLPLLRAKLGENYKQTSAAFIWATIARTYAARRTGLKKEMFGYLPGGYAHLLERFGQVLRDEQVTVHLNSRVESVERRGDIVRVVRTGGAAEEFDRVVVTTPAPVTATLCPQLSEDERTKLRGILYQGIVCASVLLKRSLSPYYVTNITDDWVPFTAVIEMSALVDKTQLGGHALVYLPRYATQDDPIFSVPDAELETRFIGALRRMHPELTAEDIVTFKVSRVRYVHALSTLGYSESLPPMRSSVPGVYIVNSAHIVNGTLNVNETVSLAERALPLLMEPAQLQASRMAS